MMTPMTRFTLALTIACSLPVALAANPGPAAPVVQTTDDPRQVIEARYAQIQTLGQSTTDEAQLREQVKALTLEFVDFDAFSAETIKAAWEGLTVAERTEFVLNFKRLIQATYARHFKPRQDLKITYRQPTEFAEGRAQVATTIAFEKSAVDVDYRFLRRMDNSWWVYDLVIDEVSLARNYRAQFRRILKDDGFPALIAKIKSAVERKEKGADASDEL